MRWNKIILSLVVILLYISLVFMGANVFFPKYAGSHSYYNEYRSCSYPEGKADAPVYIENETCMQEQRAAQDAFEIDKRQYDGNKYVFIVILNLLVLIAAFFITAEDSVIIGLFLGATITSFISTWVYFDTQSKIGFGILFVMFFVTLSFIAKKKETFTLR
ncbi:MAG TPA: hypothetical protein VJJ79_01730 [Candidatus Nanoarchaeia archaeon]|nr:hypothetical protein [Candidatus Nanoarchaeia archaeon]